MVAMMPPGDTPFADRILSALPGAVFVIDQMGVISFATDRAAALVGRRRDDLMGVSVLEFVTPDRAAPNCQFGDARCADSVAAAARFAEPQPAQLRAPGSSNRGLGDRRVASLSERGLAQEMRQGPVTS